MRKRQAAPSVQSSSPAPAKAGVGRFMRGWRVRNHLSSALILSGSGFAAGTLGGVEINVARAHSPTAATAAYRDGPPAGFSGGFGEDNCQACHTSEKVNTDPGSVRISAPARYAPGLVYDITVTLSRPGLALGGFQFTARFEDDSSQAGTLAIAPGQEGRIKLLTDRGVQYAYHSRPGTTPAAPDVARWTIRWTAPAGNRAVQFNVAANAANGDESQFGDFIYTARAQSRSR